LIVQAQSDDRPNVIFIICDDLNDYEGVFGGHPQAITPNMNALAASGVQFMNAASNVPVCMPSRNCLFTGVYPHESKDFGWTGRKEHPVLKYNKPFVQLLHENGYYTAGSGKLLHKHEAALWDSWGMDVKYNYGPVYYDGTAVGAHPGVPAPYREIGAIDGSFGDFASAGGSPGVKGSPGFVYGNDLKPFRYVSDNDRDLMQDELHAQWAVEKIRQFENEGLDQPFFLGIGFVRPHTPLYAPKKYFDMYPLDELELADWIEGDENDTYYKDNFSEDMKGPRYYRTILESYGGDRELALKKFLQAYLACVSFVDEQIGTILDGLENSKYRDNTIVILTSDHGWQMGEKQYLFKNSAWEESARVPMVIRTPEAMAGGKVEHPVALVDIYPTLVDYCKLEGDHKVSEKGAKLGGYSLRQFLEDPTADNWDGPEGSLTIIGNTGVNSTVSDQNFSYRTKDWRYIVYRDGSEELYDHRTDKNEWVNLAYNAEYLQIKKELKEQLHKIVPVDSSALFSDDYESYPPGTDLETMDYYNLWGQYATVTVSDDTSGLGPYGGNQFALTNSAWASLVVPLNLNADRKYHWKVATKVETDNPEDADKRKRNVQVKSGDHIYCYTDIDQSIDDWVLTSSDFIIEEGFEAVNLQVTGNMNAPMGIDDFYLFEEPVPYMKMYYDGEIVEREEEGEKITLILYNDMFSDLLNPASWKLGGLPDGVSIGTVVRLDSSMVQIELTGNSSLSIEGFTKIGIQATGNSDQFRISEAPLSAYYDIVFSPGNKLDMQVGDKSASGDFRIFPNPASTFLYVDQNKGEDGRIELLSVSGRHILSRDISSELTRLDLPPGLRGIYLVRLQEQASTYTKKVMIFS